MVNNKWNIRKSGNGWAVDEKIGSYWVFYDKFSTKKEAENFVNNQSK